MTFLEKADPEIHAAIRAELARQRATIELIASENFTSLAVMEAQGSVLTNKYAEGLPGKRYYGGCEHVDVAEALARERACQLFGADHANAQPHSGASANLAAYYALINTGDTILAMNLAHGGHLTHGSPVNFSGRLFKVVAYGVGPETGTIDFDEVERLAQEHKPKLIVAGASAYPRTLPFDKFRAIADKVGARLMVDMAHIAGLVAAGLHPNPVPYCDIVTTTTHKTLRGPRAGLILCNAEHAKAVDSQVFPGFQGGPLMHVIAAKAVALKEAATPEFRAYQINVVGNAKALAAALVERGYKLVSGGTDNHLMLVDLSGHRHDLTGKQAEALLHEAGITVNKNMVPYDKRTPFVTSGIRIGTPAMTTRGFTIEDFIQTGKWIADVLDNPGDEALRKRVAAEVAALLARRPLYAPLG